MSEQRLYISLPQPVEAIQWTGDNWLEIIDAIPDKTVIETSYVDGVAVHSLRLLTGVDGAQEWVPVPVGHWLVHPPGDLSDVWPVEDKYFQVKYEEVEDA